MNEPQTNIYEFGEFQVDAVKSLLIKGKDESLPLTPKVFDLLLYLVQNSGKIIEKDELMSVIWTDTIVEENNLNKNISVLRRVLGEKPGEKQFIETVKKHGFRFVVEVQRIHLEETADAVQACCGSRRPSLWSCVFPKDDRAVQTRRIAPSQVPAGHCFR